MRKNSTILAAAALCILPGNANAQVTMPNEADKWNLEVTPYLWAAGLEGILTVGPSASNVDVSFGDVIENLDFSLAAHVELSKESLTLIGEAFYVDLGATGQLADGSPVEADVQQFIGEFAAGYRVGRSVKSADFVAGVRYTRIGSELSSGGVSIADSDVSWFDPFVGIRFHWDFYEKLPITLRGDVGGFEIGGADWTGKITGGVGYRVTPQIALNVGWRVLLVDYWEGTGSEQFIYDVTQHGLIAGVTFAF